MAFKGQHPDAWVRLTPPLGYGITVHAYFDTRPCLQQIKRLKPAVYSAQQPLPSGPKDLIPHARHWPRFYTSPIPPLPDQSLFPARTGRWTCPREPPQFRERLQNSGVILTSPMQHRRPSPRMESSTSFGVEAGWQGGGKCCVAWSLISTTTNNHGRNG